MVKINRLKKSLLEILSKDDTNKILRNRKYRRIKKSFKRFEIKEKFRKRGLNNNININYKQQIVSNCEISPSFLKNVNRTKRKSKSDIINGLNHYCYDELKDLEKNQIEISEHHFSDECSENDSYNKILDVNSFKEKFINDEIFLDNTLLIKQVIELRHNDKILKIAPPKTGKTYNLLMLKFFLEAEFDEFGNILSNEKNSNHFIFFNDQMNLDITKTLINCGPNIVKEAKQIQGTAPVLFFDFKKLYLSSPESLSLSFARLYIEIFEKFQFRGNASNSFEFPPREELEEHPWMVVCWFKYLINYLRVRFNNQKVWILIDDFEYPFIEALKNNTKEFDPRVPGDSGADLKYNVNGFDRTRSEIELFLKPLISINSYLRVFATGTHVFNFEDVFDNLSLFSSFHSYLDEFYGINYSFAKFLMKRKMNRLNFEKERRKIYLNRLRRMAYRNHSFRNLTLFNSDFNSFYYNNDLNEFEETCWFEKGHSIYETVKTIIEINKNHLLPWFYKFIREPDYEILDFKYKSINIKNLINGKVDTIIKFMFLSGIFNYKDGTKIKFVNGKIKKQFINLISLIWNR